MPRTVVINTDIIWLVLQHAAYTGDLWDHRTLRECCRVSREWYPLAKAVLFRFIVLRNRQQVRVLQQTRGKHLQIGHSAPPKGLGYDVPVHVNIWQAHTRILECHWSHDFRFNDIRHALTLFPSLYEIRISVHFYEHLPADQDDGSLPIPSTIRALRLAGARFLPGHQNVACTSSIVSLLSKYSRLHCLQFEGRWVIPHLQSPWPFQSIQSSNLLYLEIEIGASPALSGGLFDNLLYLILHQKSIQWDKTQRTTGVFKRVKSLTELYHSAMTSLETVLPLSRLSKTFPALTELRLGIHLYRMDFPTIAPLLSQIPSGLVSLSLFIEVIVDPHTHTGQAESQPMDGSMIPSSLRYFEYGLGHIRTLTSDDPSVIRPFLDSCEAMGVQFMPSRVYDLADIVTEMTPFAPFASAPSAFNFPLMTDRTV